MPRLIVFTILLCAVLAHLSAQTGSHGTYPNEYPGGNYAQGYPGDESLDQRIQQLLELWEARYLPQLPDNEQDAALDLIAELRGKIWELSLPGQQTYRHSAYPRPMHPREFEQFSREVKKTVFGDDALDLIGLVAEDNYFSASQIATVLDQLTWSDDKLDALRVMYPRCVDKRGKYKILACFTFSSDKDEAEKIIRVQH